MSLHHLPLSLSLLLLSGLGCDGAKEDPDPVDSDGDGYVEAEDCDDQDAGVYPGAIEVCDGVDQDCNGVPDDEAIDARPYWTDADGDGYGDPSTQVQACEAPSAEAVENGQDCDDSSADAFPGNVERPCDDLDNDCEAATPDVGLRVPGDADTVQEALDLAAEGDVVCVEPGVWGPVVIDRPITLASTEGSALTSLDAASFGPVVTLTGTEGVTISGFTLLNGASADGGGHGVRVEGASGVLLEDLVMADFPSAWAGAGILLDGVDDATLRSVIATGMTALAGGGLYATSTSGLTVEDSVFEGSLAGTGAGIALNQVTGATVRGSSFTGNQVSVGGGGAGLAQQGGDLLIEDCLFQENRAEEADGAALWSDQGASLRVVRSTFFDNRTSWATDVGYGDGIYAGAGVVLTVEESAFDTCPSGGCVAGVGHEEMTVSNSTFTQDEVGAFALYGGPLTLEGNTWTDRGTAHVWVYGSESLSIRGEAFEGGAGAFPAVIADTLQTVNVEDSTFTDLSTLGDDSLVGAGLYISAADEVIIRGSVFTGNEGYDGGAATTVFQAGGTLLIEDCVYRDNTARGGFGGALYLGGADSMLLIGLEITGNQAEFAGGGLAIGSVGTCEITDTRIEDNTATYWGGGVYAVDIVTSIWDPTLEVTSNLADEGEGGGVFCDQCGGNPSDANVHDNQPDEIECVNEPLCSPF